MRAALCLGAAIISASQVYRNYLCLLACPWNVFWRHTVNNGKVCTKRTDGKFVVIVNTKGARIHTGNRQRSTTGDRGTTHGDRRSHQWLWPAPHHIAMSHDCYDCWHSCLLAQPWPCKITICVFWHPAPVLPIGSTALWLQSRSWRISQWAKLYIIGQISTNATICSHCFTNNLVTWPLSVTGVKCTPRNCLRTGESERQSTENRAWLRERGVPHVCVPSALRAGWTVWDRACNAAPMAAAVPPTAGWWRRVARASVPWAHLAGWSCAGTGDTDRAARPCVSASGSWGCTCEQTCACTSGTGKAARPCGCADAQWGCTCTPSRRSTGCTGTDGVLLLLPSLERPMPTG